ncbi:hypothetical protein CDD82_3150 [Ophiocordyceps australis]|uniref:Ribosomal lysine N-methyltransferase 4 n=1 Tax=Ophiocordyceps australis TaxID=1399860 RepID=A0A2C5ZFP7_9HYPO|nr:hypothetical protein CDD82_3150 [Ophiocordyceps australis]
MDFEAKTASFLQWFKSIPDASFSDALEIADFRSRNAGRGIIAKRDISADETLFTIPRKAILSIETSSLPQRLPYLFDSDGDQALDSWSGLILVLMYEFLLDSSQWKPYFQILPQVFDTPMFWSDQELAELQASAVRGKIGRTEADGLFRTKLLPMIRRHPDVFGVGLDVGDEQLFQLAHRMASTIMAYAFDMENDEEEEEEEGEDGWVEDREEKHVMGMVPMADILNADAEFNAHVNHGPDALTVTSLRPIKAGQEILNYYGPHANSELLRRYGYVTAKHACYDVVEIPWAIVKNAVADHVGVSEQTIQDACNRLDEEDLEDVFFLERETCVPSSDGTLASRAFVQDLPVELHQQLKLLLKALHKGNAGLAKDKRKRDDSIREIMIKSLLAVEAQYSTRPAQDEAILREALGQRKRMAVEVRLGEKKLLQEAKEALSGNTDHQEPVKRVRVD